MKKITALTFLLLILMTSFAFGQEHHIDNPNFFDYLKLFLENGTSILILILIIGLLIAKPKILERITSFGAFGISFQLEKIKESVDSANNRIMNIKGQLDSLSEEYLKSAKVFDPDSSADERDKLGSALKKAAASLDNIDFVLKYLNKNENEKNVFAAACAIQVNPHPKFFKPILDYLEDILKEKELNHLTLKTLYRFVMCVENITRTDNSRDERYITEEERNSAIQTMNKLKSSKRAQQDLENAGTRSIVTRIDRTIKVLQKTNIT